MKKTFSDTRFLDSAVCQKYGITEDILMENAASALEKNVIDYLQNLKKEDLSILIVCGSGNNGADGYALARKLTGFVLPNGSVLKVLVFKAKEPKSRLAFFQFNLWQNISAQNNSNSFCTNELCDADVIVDCFFGSGFSGDCSAEVKSFIVQMNNLKGFKIACDVPSCLTFDSKITPFKSDLTVTMGAFKTVLFSEISKDFCGKIECCNLGIQNEFFCDSVLGVKEEAFVLEKTDLILPHRRKNNVHKGTFGHTAVFCGDKIGASIIASKAAFAFGSGLVSLILPQKQNFFDSSFVEIMQTDFLPKNTTCVCLGMGLGNFCKDAINKIINREKSLSKNLSFVFDADFFNFEGAIEFLKGHRNSEIVLTPHPKEFTSLWKMATGEIISVEELQKNRIDYVKKFCSIFENVSIILKGSVCVIGTNNQFFLNPFGLPCLSKGGSGDVLSGLVASLLSQGYCAKDACISASLAHALASTLVKCDYAMNPLELINCVSMLDSVL